MRLRYQFRSLLDWAPLDHGHDLTDGLKMAGLAIDKVGTSEPIREEFTDGSVHRFWTNPSSGDNSFTCDFLFKGMRPWAFSGMVVWHKNLSPNRTRFNSLFLYVNVPKRSLAESDLILDLGDRLFAWTGAVSGFVTLESLYNPLARPPAQRIYLPGLFWINYFGRDYCDHPDFLMPAPHTRLSSGVRMILGSSPHDPRLSDADGYLFDLKSKMGQGWFAEGEPDGYRLPTFDFSALRRSEG